MKEGQSLKIILIPEGSKNIEVTLNTNQVAAWNKLSKEKKLELKSLEKEKFFKEINKEVAKNRSLEIVFESGEKANLALDLVHFWKLLSAEEQALRKTGNAQALLRELKDMYNQEARTKRLATKKTSKSTEEMNLMETSSANQDSNEMAAETLGREEDLATSEAFEANEDEKHSRGSVKRKRIAEETKDDDSPIIIQHYVLPPKKRKIYSVKEEPREIYEEENNANINDVPSKLSSATVTEHVGKSKEGKAL